jgi:hypothetical protein
MCMYRNLVFRNIVHCTHLSQCVASLTSNSSPPSLTKRILPRHIDVYIYMCVCVCVCVYIYIYIHTYIYVLVHIVNVVENDENAAYCACSRPVKTQLFASVTTQDCYQLCVYIHIHMYTKTHIPCIHACMHTYTYYKNEVYNVPVTFVVINNMSKRPRRALENGFTA